MQLLRDDLWVQLSRGMLPTGDKKSYPKAMGGAVDDVAGKCPMARRALSQADTTSGVETTLRAEEVGLIGGRQASKHIKSEVYGYCTLQ